MPEDDPLDEVLQKVDETQETSKEYSEYQRQIKKAKQELAQKVQKLEEEEEISTTKADHILQLIQNAEYGKAREEIKEAYNKQGLEFDAEEKNVFAQKFTEEYQELQANTERIRNTLVKLNEKVEREDLVSYLYGKHSSMNKGDIREVLDALDKISKSSFSIDDQARVLSAFNHDLTITTTRKILREVKKEADN